MEKVKPIKVTDPKTNEVYILEFSRESVKFAEDRKFDISELFKYPTTNIPALWFYAFRKNHRNVARNKTDELLADLGGLKTEEIERLVRLYNETIDSLIIDDADMEETRKNAKVTVEL